MKFQLFSMRTWICFAACASAGAVSAACFAPLAIAQLEPFDTPVDQMSDRDKYLLTSCRSYEECTAKGTGNENLGRWTIAASFYRNAQKYAATSYQRQYAFASVAIADVNSIWEKHRGALRRGEKSEAGILLRDANAQYGRCPTHDACMRIGDRMLKAKDYQSALLNYKSALFRKPGSKDAEGSIRMAVSFIVE